jgi:DNA-binding GntR family transcriptional regulator
MGLVRDRAWRTAGGIRERHGERNVLRATEKQEEEETEQGLEEHLRICAALTIRDTAALIQICST